MKPYPLVVKLMAEPGYLRLLDRLERAEAERPFCKHDLTHFLDVARIAALLNRETALGLAEEDLYLAALLHDIGRLGDPARPHREESVRLARPLLDAIGCPEERAEAILSAIAQHHYQGKAAPVDFPTLLSLADNLSRACYRCPAAADCYWPPERKNPFPTR